MASAKRLGGRLDVLFDLHAREHRRVRGDPVARHSRVFGVDLAKDRVAPVPVRDESGCSCAAERVEDDARRRRGAAFARRFPTDRLALVAIKRLLASLVWSCHDRPMQPPDASTTRRTGAPHSEHAPFSDVPARMQRRASSGGNVAKCAAANGFVPIVHTERALRVPSQ